MIRRVSAALAAIAVVAGGLTFGAVPAGAAVSNASISPSVWQPSEQAQAVLTFDSSSASTGLSGSKMSVEIGWGWVYQYANPQNLANNTTSYTATHTVSAGVGTYTCATIGATFSSVGFATPPGNAASVKCQVSRSAANPSDPGQQVRLTNEAGSGFIFAAPNTVTVTFPAPTITAPAAGPASDTWRIIDVGGGSGVTVTTVVPGPDGSLPPSPPPVTLNFDGNGGTCSPSSVTGDQGTWGTALTADQCTNGAKKLAFFSTSPTAAIGATNVWPGGPIYFLEDNRLYAIWGSDPPSPPSNVVATPRLNSVTVSWSAAASDGGDPIRAYSVRYKATTDANYSNFCSTNAATFECSAALPATNTKYTFVVTAANQVGRAESAPSSPVSPYDFKDVTASRGDVLFGLGGTKVDANGSAPGLAGQALNVQYKVGSADWTTVANGVKVNAESRFSWSRKFPASVNKKVVTVRFTYGADAVSGTYVLPRGGGAGDLSEPRNIKATGELNKISLTWDAPKFDGGAKIIGYTMCAQGIGTLCRDVGATGRGEFRNLNPGIEYSFTVAARTASKAGPKGKANKKVTFTEASVRVLEREPGLVTTEVKGRGFKDRAKFRVEVAIVPTNGRPRDTWMWDEIRDFTADRSFAKAFGTELGSSYDDQTIAVRLVTPLGSVYSRAIRPPG